MKTPDFLNALPSVNELLDDPRVRSVADHLSRSVATTRVRGYLEQLAAEAKRRAAGAEEAFGAALPESMRDLVSRVSRYLSQGDGWRVGAAINATGRLRGGPWASAPLSDAAVERMVLSSADFRVGGSPSDHSSQDAGAADAVCRATGAEAAAVFSSHTSALWMCLASLSRGDGPQQEIVIARGDLITLGGGVRVADLIHQTGLQVREVGAVDGTTLGDYAAAMSDRTAGLLRVASDAWPTGPTRAATAELASLARQHSAVLIEDVGAAPLVELPDEAPHASAVKDALAAAPVAATVAAGADLVVACGDGLIGGPACGLVLGAEAATGRVRSAPLAASVAIDPHLSSALAATVEQLIDPKRFWFDVPVWSLLTTPLENLQSRAERLASLLMAEVSVASAEVVSHSSAEAPVAGLPIRLPTVAVAVAPANKPADDLSRSLRAGEPAVEACADSQDRVLLDLRTVFPRQDAGILDALANLADKRATG